MNRMTFTHLFDLHRHGPWTYAGSSAQFYLWWELFKQWHDNYFSWGFFSEQFILLNEFFKKIIVDIWVKIYQYCCTKE